MIFCLSFLSFAVNSASISREVACITSGEAHEPTFSYYRSSTNSCVGGADCEFCIQWQEIQSEISSQCDTCTARTPEVPMFDDIGEDIFLTLPILPDQPFIFTLPTAIPIATIPSQSPITSKPTAMPTTVFPTAFPTFAPSSAQPSTSPSASPTTDTPSTSPTRNPTSTSPTTNPTSSTPSQSPTTSSPTTSPTTDPTTPPTSHPTTSPIYNHPNFTADVMSYPCQTASCDNQFADDHFGLTPAQACSKCYGGGYVRLENENDQTGFLPDIDTQTDYLFSFWTALNLVDGGIDFIRYRYEQDGNFRRFLYIEDFMLKLQYYYNGSFEVFGLPTTLVDGEQYSFVLTAANLENRRRLSDDSGGTSLMELKLVATGQSARVAETWTRVMRNPSPMIYGYEIRDELQNSDFVFGFHTMTEAEEDSLHTSNMLNWDHTSVKQHNIWPVLICAGAAAFLCSLSIMVNICQGHELPEIMAFIAPTFALLDFVTDAQLAYVLFDDGDHLRWWGLAVVAIPVLLNLFTLFRWFYRNISVDTFLGRWIRQHITWVKLLMFVSSTNVAVMKVAWSQLFPTSYFMIPISFSHKIKLLRWGSVITTFVEDIPSLILQITILCRTGSSEYVSLAVQLALYTSCLSLLYGVIEACTNLKPTSGTSLKLQVTVSNPKRTLLFRKKTIESQLEKRFANTHFDVLILENTQQQFYLEVVVYSPDAKIDEISEAVSEIIDPYLTHDTIIDFHKAPQASKILELLLSVKALCDASGGGITILNGTLNVDFSELNPSILKELTFLFAPLGDEESMKAKHDWQAARIAKELGQTWGNKLSGELSGSALEMSTMTLQYMGSNNSESSLTAWKESVLNPKSPKRAPQDSCLSPPSHTKAGSELSIVSESLPL